MLIARRLFWLCAIFFSIAAFSVPAHSEPPRLTDNGSVLLAFQQAAGGELPAIVEQKEGGTKIEWHGGATVDYYQNSSSGGTLLTPVISGNFERTEIRSDVRATSQNGSFSYLQLSATNSNDFAAQRNPNLVNMVQAGYTSSTLQLKAGDVPVNFSTLGTQNSFRGLFGQVQMAETSLAASIGYIAPTWNDIASADSRTQYLRNAGSAKLERSVFGTGRIFATYQFYSDNSSSMPFGQSFLAAASSQVETIGFAYQAGSLGLTSEFGIGNWKEEDQESKVDNAYVLDATWQGNQYGLRAGYHSIGTYFSSLSSQAMPGVEESYLGGNWQALSWLALQADLRSSENRLAIITGSSSTNGILLTQLLKFDEKLPGLSLTLTENMSYGQDPSGGKNGNDTYGANIGYVTGPWNSTLSYNRTSVTSDADSTSDSKTDAWMVNLGRSLNSPTAAGWSANIGVNGSYQNQSIGTGNNISSQWGLNFNGTIIDWIILNGVYSEGTLTPATGSGAMNNRNYSLEASHPFRNQNIFKVYVRNTANFSGNSALANEASTVGTQVVLVF